METYEIKSILTKMDNILSKEDKNELEKYCLEIEDELDYGKLNGILFYEIIADYLCQEQGFLKIKNSLLVHCYFNFFGSVPSETSLEFAVEFKNKTEINIGIRCFDSGLDSSASEYILNGGRANKHSSDIIIDEEGLMYRKFLIKNDFGSKESIFEMMFLTSYIRELETKCWEFVLPMLNLPKS
jgi:hypothetical protein